MAIYNSKWYYLNANEQKMISLMINRLQNGECLTNGPFETINFYLAAAVSIFKLISRLI